MSGWLAAEMNVRLLSIEAVQHFTFHAMQFNDFKQAAEGLSAECDFMFMSYPVCALSPRYQGQRFTSLTLAESQWPLTVLRNDSRSPAASLYHFDTF